MDLKDFENIEKELQIKRQEKANLLSKIESLSEEKISLLNEITQIRNDIRKMIEQKKETSSLLEELNSQRKAMAIQFDKEKKEFNTVQERIKQASDNLLIEEKRINNKIDEAKKKRSEADNIMNRALEMMRKTSDDSKRVEVLKEELGQKIGELNDSVSKFNSRNEELNKLLKKTELDSFEYSKKIKESDKKERDYKELETKLKNKLDHVENRIKILDSREIELNKRDVELNEKNALIERKRNSIESLQKSIDLAEKELKIKQLRVDEIIRTNKIDNELKILESRVTK